MYNRIHGTHHEQIIASAHLIIIGALLLIFCATAKAEPLKLKDAVSEALEGNPGIAAIQSRAQALAQLPSQNQTLPDPRLSLNLMNLPLDEFSFTQEGMTQFQIGISQAIPYPGKLALHGKSAEYEAGAAEADFEEKKLQLVSDVKSVWWNLFYLDRALEAVDNNQNLLEQFVGIAQTRYEVGQGLQQDVLLAQLELSKLRDTSIKLTQLRNNEAIRLNLLLARDTRQAIELPRRVEEKLPTLFDEEQLRQMAISNRPLLSAQSLRTNAARTRRDLAEKGNSPDFMVGAIYGIRNGTNADGSSRSDMASLMLSMNLPLYSEKKQDRTVDQRNAEWLQQKYQLQDHHNRVQTEISSAINDYTRAGEQSTLFKKEIIPQANQTVEAMLAGYQVGKVDFLNLVRSQTTLYDYTTQYWKTISIANQALARLTAAVGEEKIHE